MADSSGAWSPEALRGSIGQAVEYQGRTWVIHDVVDDPPLLVLRKLADPGAIQADSFGKAVRRAPPLLEIPLLAEDGSGPSEELRRVRLAGTPAGR